MVFETLRYPTGLAWHINHTAEYDFGHKYQWDKQGASNSLSHGLYISEHRKVQAVIIGGRDYTKLIGQENSIDHSNNNTSNSNTNNHNVLID